jgi:hypothetical protein
MFALAEVTHPNSQMRLQIMAVVVDLTLDMSSSKRTSLYMYGRCHVTCIEVIPTTFTCHESLFADDEALSRYRHLTQIIVHLESDHRISPTENTHEVCQ